MIINRENINSLPISDRNKELLNSLYEDLNEMNSVGNKSLQIQFIDEHTDWPCERTDPCPDYYGMFQIIDNKTEKTIGIEMTIEDLDMVMCALYNYIVD